VGSLRPGQEIVVKLSEDAARLDRLLQSAGFAIVGGTPLFRLAQHKGARAFLERLGWAGILLRPFQAKPEWLRFGIPHAPSEWERLEAALDTSEGSIHGGSRKPSP
jgi:cobalamin biosynthesis protein CobC